MGSSPKPRPVPIGQVFTPDQIVAAYRCMEENKAARLGMGSPGDLNHLMSRQRKSGRERSHY